MELKENDTKILKEANGLRNRIVHKYNRTDDEIARESIESMLPEIKRRINKFEEKGITEEDIQEEIRAVRNEKAKSSARH